MENILWVLILIPLTLPALAILIPIVLIDLLIRLLHRVASLLSGKKDKFIPDVYLNNRPEQHGEDLSDNVVSSQITGAS